MSFQFSPKVAYLKHTTESGQLLTAGDTAAQHTCGTKYYDTKNDKGYVYVYAEAALTSQKATYIVERGNSTNIPYSAIAIADTAYHGYVGAPATAITATTYGWVQVSGNVTALAGLTSEARTAGGQLDHTGGVLSYLAPDNEGITIPSVFGMVRVANTAAATTGNARLLGVRILPHT